MRKCKAPHARFQHENEKLFGNLLPHRVIIERSNIELSSARIFDAASFVEHMPHSVLGRLFVWCVVFFPKAAALAMGSKGWSGTTAVQSSASIMTCMTGPKTQGQLKQQIMLLC